MALPKFVLFDIASAVGMMPTFQTEALKDVLAYIARLLDGVEANPEFTAEVCYIQVAFKDGKPYVGMSQTEYTADEIMGARIDGIISQ